MEASRRLPLAIGAAVLFAAIVGIVVVTRDSDEVAATPTGTCFTTWNQDEVALSQDGQHAYESHGYRETLVTRLDAEGEIIQEPDDDLEPDDPDARCAVIFASPQVDEEPDFGVRVFARGRWTGLVLADGVELEAVTELQAQAVSLANAVLRADGTLVER